MFARSWIEPIDHAGNAAFAAAIAAFACAASACAYSPMTSLEIGRIAVRRPGRAGDPFAADVVVEICSLMSFCRQCVEQSALRARLLISAAAPNVHGAIWSVWLTRLTSAPSAGVATVTMSPTRA